jgi:FtsP/CotA-like multicopper oxidase with cupredoxin domain
LLLAAPVATNASEAIYPDAQPVYTSSDGELNVTLTIGEALFESSSLVQKVVGYDGQLGGPTFRVKPGDTVRITLVNELPEEACNTSVPEMWNQYHAISETNLHVHGLFVPASENPTFIKLLPGESYEYEIHVPESHQGGTHWYHPHIAGSTSLQAGGGALGLFIVEDLEGDLPEEITVLPEVNLRIQFFNFTYLQTDFALGTSNSSYVELCRMHCLPAENRDGCYEYFFENGPDQGTYNTTPSPDGLEYETLTVNGVEQPTIQLTAGQWYRFRTLFVPTRFRTLEPAIPDCDFLLLAKDGRYIPVAPREIQSGYMVSGSR